MLICGVDEAGRGALAGEVVAAAVVFGDHIPDGLADSKKLSDKKRRMLSEQIMEQSLCYAITTASVSEIEKYNILNATGFAMQRAVHGIIVCPDEVQIDGNYSPSLPYPVKTIIGGDSLVPSIMAASILAKVYRDNLMIKLGEKYPEYGFAQHKAYGTAQHLQKIAEHGICPAHRKTFAPISSMVT